MRARLIQELRFQPGNVNQLSVRMGVEYRTVAHHIEVLRRNSLLETSGDHYGLTYFLNPWLEAHMETFDEICLKLRFNMKVQEERTGAFNPEKEEDDPSRS